MRPNIIFIIADDHRYNAIGAAGDPVVQTPELDALAESGLMMTATHIVGGVDGAVCVPCRSCINTGTHIFQATKSQKIGDYPDSNTMTPGLATMPSWFRAHGYHTHAIGKWHNDAASFTKSFCNGDNLLFGGMSEHRAVPVFDYNAEGLYPPEARRMETTFSTELFTESAIRFIEQHNTEQPFFLYLAYTAPHDPRTAPEPYASMYDPQHIPLPLNYMDEHPFDNGELDVRDEKLAAYPRKQEEVRQHIADYYAMITHMDHHIGKVVTALNESGRGDNTIIVYTADHGLAVGQHGLMGKQNMYDHSIRVPWIMKGPGIPAKRSEDALAYQFDIFPTLCELAGISAPKGIEGKSLEPLVKGETEQGRETVYALYKDIQRMVKDDRWKLIVYRPAVDQQRGSYFVQLFDLKNDPSEVNNLATDPMYRQQLDKLNRELAEWMERVHDPYASSFL